MIISAVNRFPIPAVLLTMTLFLTACNEHKSPTSEVSSEKEQNLIHSYAVPSEAKVKHLNWNAKVDFEQKIIGGVAEYLIETASDANRLTLDVKNLTIEHVFVDGEETKEWWLGPKDKFLGQALEIGISPETKNVAVHYETTEGAEALQWLKPEQTADNTDPFLFTQSQAILARTWIPCQDSPGIRYTYNAQVNVPKGLMALMSASNSIEIDSSGVYEFKMEQPIPSYLMALAVGNLEFRSIGENTGVYAEPSVVEAAAYEFEDMQKMLESAERLYGEYKWGRYDVLVLPPSFPFGGMENPRLTFATPTILAGDKSLTALVAHELAHSWSGNLVTNSTWDDFWLNEGFTVYFERRIMESVYGKSYADMLKVLGQQDLEHTLEKLSDAPEDTHLKLSLEGRDPDDGMTDIAYEKGNAFLLMLEENMGRDVFDAYLNQYFSENAFKTMTTEQFLENLKMDLFDGDEEQYIALKIDEWVYGEGIPDNAVVVSSPLFGEVEKEMNNWLEGKEAERMKTEDWTTHHWLHFLRSLPDSLGQQQMHELDAAFSFTTTGNSEIACEWFLRAIENDYAPADDEVEAFLIKVGRRKFLMPIYQALIEADDSKQRARNIYQKAKANYHSVSTNSIDALLK
ncbi:MAG: M1 family metallopeptidase [Salibacteraceae bacterium]